MTSLCSDSGFLDALAYSCPPAAGKCTVDMLWDSGGPIYSKNDFSLSCLRSYLCCVLGVRHLPEPQKLKPVSNRISSGWQPSPASTCDLGPLCLWPLCLIPILSFLQLLFPLLLCLGLVSSSFLCSLGLRRSSYIFGSQLHLLRELLWTVPPSMDAGCHPWLLTTAHYMLLSS